MEKNVWYLNKKNVKRAVKQTGKRWSKSAEETLNSAVLGIILKSAVLCGSHKTITRAEIMHTLRSINSEV